MNRIQKKFVIAGSHGAGRETFMASVADVFSPLRDTTLAVPAAYGRIFVNRQLTYFLYRVNAARRFGGDWQTFISDAAGYILLVDGSRPETFMESRHMLHTLRSLYPGTPFVIAVNKQDVSGTIDETTLRMVWKLNDPRIPVVPCIATDISMARCVFSTLLMQTGEAPL